MKFALWKDFFPFQKKSAKISFNLKHLWWCNIVSLLSFSCAGKVKKQKNLTCEIPNMILMSVLGCGSLSVLADSLVGRLS